VTRPDPAKLYRDPLKAVTHNACLGYCAVDLSNERWYCLGCKRYLADGERMKIQFHAKGQPFHV
jgi:hypothetical protein